MIERTTLAAPAVCYDCGFPVSRPKSWLCDRCEDETPQPARALPIPGQVCEKAES